MTIDRRKFLQRAALGTLAFQTGAAQLLLTPREARARALEFRVLAPAEVRALEALGETLLPGAREAGLAHFIDQQLASRPEDCLLMLRYLDVPPPYADFYRAALGALDGAARSAHGKLFAELEPAQAESFVAAMGRENPPGWQGPPAPFAYFVLRSDAVDVVYGTIEGFEKLGVPYMPHIVPERKW